MNDYDFHNISLNDPPEEEEVSSVTQPAAEAAEAAEAVTEPVLPTAEAVAEAAPAAEPVTEAFEAAAPAEEVFEETAPAAEAFEETPPAEEVFEEAAPVVEAFEEAAPAEEVFEEAAPAEEVFEEAAPAEEVFEETAQDWAAEAPAREPVEAAQTETPAENAQPDYNSFFYASGPVTARPAQEQLYYTTQEAPHTETRTQNGAKGSHGKHKKHRSGGFWKKAAALVLVCALVGGGAGVGGALLVNSLQGNGSGSSTNLQVASPRETKELTVVTVNSGKLLSASEVYKANVNSTVGITTEITTNWWGYQSTSAAAGSGFILTEDGYILTNEHVIEDANSINVAMYDGTTYPATLVGYDASNDIAVLKIDAKGLTPVTLGSSDALEVGDEVVAIGNPLGELTFSLTKGNVSALNRAVTLSSNVTMKLIQTDAAINSGNSGGALFNMYGEVVGITNAKYSTSGYSGEASIDNIGFAIPINSVREIVTSIIEKGYVATPYIGVTVANVSEESQSYGMPQGAAIRSVEQGGPAEKGGLRANDIVTAINGETITSYTELSEHIAASQVGDELELTVYRRGETLTLIVTVGEKTQVAPSAQSGQSGSGGFGWGR